MYPELLVAAGAIILLYSLSLFSRLIPAIKWPYLRKSWKVLFFLMLLFLAGYLAYLRILLLPAVTYQPSALWVSAVLFFGALFMVAVIRASYQLIDGLQATEDEVTSRKWAIEQSTDDIATARKDIELKKEELEKALEDVYILKDKLEKGKVKDIRKTNKRLGEIRNNLAGKKD